jgi:hypothetical protein
MVCIKNNLYIFKQQKNSSSKQVVEIVREENGCGKH